MIYITGDTMWTSRRGLYGSCIRILMDAILQRSKEELRRNGIVGMMTLEEFTEHMNEKSLGIWIDIEEWE